MIDLFGNDTPVIEPKTIGRMSKYQLFKKAHKYRISTTEERCKNCKHRIRKEYHDKRYNKCGLLGISNGPATDIAQNHVCDKFQKC